jgi:hypothetical protein
LVEGPNWYGRKAETQAKADPEDAKAEQSERFKETARTLGADESGQAFERALKTIVPPKRISSGR